MAWRRLRDTDDWGLKALGLDVSVDSAPLLVVWLIFSQGKVSRYGTLSALVLGSLSFRLRKGLS